MRGLGEVRMKRLCHALARGVGFGLLVVLLVGYGLTWCLHLWLVRYSSLGGVGVVVADGGAHFMTFDPTTGAAYWMRQVIWRSELPVAFGPYIWLPRVSPIPSGKGVFVPFWVFAVPALGLLWWARRRPAAAAACPECGRE